MDFETRFHRLADAKSPFCLGVDPAPGLLLAAGLDDSPSGIRAFCERLLDAGQEFVGVVKPQIAYFERFGPDGLKEMKRLLDAARERNILTVVDAKRGDIDTTCMGYAQAYLGPDSYYNADALTVTAYMGFDALAPIIDTAREYGRGVFVVVMSSNPEGRSIQTALLADGTQSVADHLAEKIADYNTRAGTKVVGAVVGATVGPMLGGVVGRLDHGLILCPGIGHQGAQFSDLKQPFADARRSIMPTMARSIVRDGFTGNVLRATIHNRSQEAIAFRRGDDETSVLSTSDVL